MFDIISINMSKLQVETNMLFFGFKVLKQAPTSVTLKILVLNIYKHKKCSTI